MPRFRLPWQKPPPAAPPPPPPPPSFAVFSSLLASTSTASTVSSAYAVLLVPAVVVVLLLAFSIVLTLYEACTYQPAKLAAKRSRRLGHVPYSKAALPETIDAVIVGSGQGGLSCGATLAQFGKTVVVLEQHEVTGGGAHCFAVDGKSKWKFDAGLHITIPLQQQVLQLACGAAAPPVPFPRLCDARHGGASDRIVLSGAQEAPLPVLDDVQIADELASRFPKHAANLRRYFDIAERVQKCFGLLTAAAVLPVALRVRLLASPLMRAWRTWAGVSSASALRQLFPGDDEATRRLLAYMTGLWLDQGSPSSRASFFMQASVFGGWQKVGVAYPTGGPQETALAMVEHIEARGGRVFIRTPVHAIVRDAASGAAVGVELANGDVIRAATVVSAVGYRATEALLRRRDDADASPSSSSAAVLPPVPPPASPLATQQSCSFLMANIALEGTADELGISESSLWVQPAHAANGYDSLRGEREYFADPLGVPVEGLPVGITFPSLKERAGGGGGGDAALHTCQLLVPAELKWFAAHLSAHDHAAAPRPSSKHAPPHVARPNQAAYDALKQRWAERLRAVLHKHYPKTVGRVVFIDISTPLTIENYLRSEHGAAIGLDVTPRRFTDPSEMRELDMRHPRVANLWRAGQDYLMAGQVLAAASGLMCALRMLGPLAAARFACRAVLLLRGAVKKP